MADLFKQMIEERFFDDIYSVMSSQISDNYDHYDLGTKTEIVNEILAADLYGMEIITIRNIEQNSDEIIVSVLVNCYIEVEDYAYGETISDDICQWFELSCSATLDKAELRNFSVDSIAAFNTKEDGN